MASDWQNAFRARDVNNDGFVSPLDALVGINRLNTRTEPSQLPTRPANSSEPYFDVNGDNFQTPIDVLIIINSLNGGLLLTADLASDTGAGRDKLTSDVSVRGSTQGVADYLQVRINGESQWRDIVDLLQADATFTLSESKLAQLIGSPLSDGAYTIDIRAGQGTPGSDLPEQITLPVHRDSTRPQQSFVSEILMSQSDKISIPLSEAVDPSTFSPTSIRLYDVTWGEDTSKTTFDNDGRYPSFELAPRSVTLSSNNREIVIVPPVNTRSIKYLVQYRAPLLDAAGNSGAMASVLANYFSPSAPTMSLAQTISMSANPQRRITEYKLSVPADDVLVWAGNQIMQSGSRIELYDVHGRMINVADPWVSGLPFTPRPRLWPVVAGEYRLRVIDPPSTLHEFHVQRLADVPMLPQNRGTLGTLLKTTLYQVHLERGEQLFVKDANGISQIAAAIDPDGEAVPNIAGVSRLQAAKSGTYVLAIYGSAFQSSIGRFETQLALAGPVLEGALDNVGDRILASFVTTPGSYYLFDIETLSSNLRLASSVTDTSRGIKVDTKQWLFVADDSDMDFSIERTSAGAQAADFRLRITPLAGVEPLQLNTSIASPAPGQAKYYFLESAPEQGQLSLEGSQRFTLIQNGAVYTSNGSRAYQGLFADGILMRVQAIADTNPWIARSVQTIRGSLTTGAPQSVTFTHGFERYELEIDRQAVQFLWLTVLNGPSANTSIRLLDESGREIQPINYQFPYAWATDMSGRYRVVIAGSGPASIGQLSFHVTTETEWPAIVDGSVQTVPSGQRAIFRLPANQSRYYFDAISANSAAVWNIFNQTGINMRAQLLNHLSQLPADWEAEVPANQINYLMADASQSPTATALTFRLNTSSPEIRTVAVGTATSGNLALAGDTVRLQWSLERGQRVQFSTLGYSTQFVKALWQPPGGQPSSPTDQVFLVPADGVYELSLMNTGASAQTYSVTLQNAPNLALGKATAGFGAVREGSLTSYQQLLVTTVEVEANTLALFDWQSSMSNSDLRLSVRKMTGEEYYRGLAMDQWIRFDQAGAYQVYIVNQYSPPQTFRFALRDVFTAPTVTIGQTYTDTLAAFESKLVRAANATASELIVTTGSEGMTLPTSTVIGGQIGNLYAAGDVVALLDNTTANSQSKSVAIQPLSSQTVLRTDQVENVVLKPGWNYFLYEPTAALTFEIKSSLAGGIVNDAFGQAVPRNDRFISIPVAGKYIVSMFNSATTDLATTIELKKYVPSQSVFTLGTTVSRTFTANEEHRYTFTLASQSKLLFSFKGFFLREDLELKDGQGRLVYFYDNFGSNFINTTVQELAAGDYTLRITGKRDQDYSLAIHDLASAAVIAPGQLTSQLAAGEEVRLYRVNLQAGQSLAITQGPQHTAQLQRYTAADRHNPAYSTFVPATTNSAGQSLILIFSGKSAKINMKLELAEVVQMNAAVGTQLTATISGVQTKHVLNLPIASPDVAFSFLASDAFATLVTPLGNRVPISDRLLFGLASGNYTVEVLSNSSSASYRFASYYLQNSPTVSLAGSSMNSSSWYRLDLTNDFQGRMILQDSTGQILHEAALEVYRQGASSREGTGNVSLKAGTYWLRVAGSTTAQLTYQFRGLPVVGSFATAAVGQTVSLNAGASYAIHRIEIPLAPGTPLIFGKFNGPASMSARYRIFSPMVDVLETAGFLQLRPDTVFYSRMASRLQIEFEGVGAVAWQLMDLAAAPLLDFDQVSTRTFDATTQRLAWKLPVSANVSFSVEQLQASSAGVQWKLVDNLGNTLTSLAAGKVWSIVSTAPLYVVASKTSTQSVDLTIKLHMLT